MDKRKITCLILEALCRKHFLNIYIYNVKLFVVVKLEEKMVCKHANHGLMI